MAKRNYFLFALFLLLLFIPLINNGFGFMPAIKSNENRRLASKPTFTIETLEQFPSNFEKWYNDHFNLRGQMMLLFSRINLFVFQKSPLPNEVIIGKNGWLFLASNELKAYQGIEHFSAFELENIRRELEYRQAYLKKRHCKMYFVVAPVKAMIYPEYMPDNIIRKAKTSFGMQLQNYLTNYSTVKPIDLYEPLKKAKSEGRRLYLYTDNHWNDIAGMVVSKTIVNRILSDSIDLPEFNFDDYLIDSSTTIGGNIAKMLAMNNELKEKWKAHVSRKNGDVAFQDTGFRKYKAPSKFAYPGSFQLHFTHLNKKLPTALIIRDSFGGSVIKPLSSCFGRSLFIWDAWEYKLNEAIVNDEKPDVVIYLVLESHLRSLLKNQSQLKK